MKKILKIFLTVILITISIISFILIYSFIRQNIIDTRINNDISLIGSNSKYKEKINISITPIKQKISCGYAVIEMFSNWSKANITEEMLYSKYNKVVTSTGKSFEKEMNIQFPDMKTTMYKNLTNTELIDLSYESLKNGIPIPFEFAAIYHDIGGDTWTLHYSLIIGMDIPNDKITIANPYGYIEEYTISDFLKATRFESYVQMPFYLKIAFNLGIFEKNTIFIVKQKN